MGRDVEKNIPLYFYDQSSGIFTGEVGSSGDSRDFTLPPGMTPLEPPSIPTGKMAVFDGSSWTLKSIDPYDDMSPEEKAIVDKTNEIIGVKSSINESLIDILKALITIISSNGLSISSEQQTVISSALDLISSLEEKESELTTLTNG